mmetsp:Transcript_8854/g.9824  ORF Transcript_8854/g.9824 Transcript_8854/m.9824 type:complete len:647 (+) Transcript_8854:3-1943(+)
MASDKQSFVYYHNEGPIRRSAKCKELISTVDGAKTLWDVLTPARKQFANRPMLGTRTKTPNGFGGYKWLTYAEADDKSISFAAGLRKLGLETRGRLGIFSQNNAQWVMAVIACVSQNFTFVPLYATLGPDAVEYISKHAEVTIALLDPPSLPQMLEALPNIPNLKHLILTSPVDKMPTLPAGVQIHNFEDIVSLGKTRRGHEDVQPDPEDLFVIMYTSGTTGLPKGVMLTHSNMVAGVASMATSDVVLTPEDVHLSYLPMAHIFEMICISAAMRAGASIGFWHGETTELIEDIQTLRPTILPGVPRVWNRVYDKIMGQIQDGGYIKRSLFSYAYASKKASVKATGSDDSMWNSIVFAKIKEALGGRCRLIITGAAPLSAPVHEFMRICFGCPVVQGYGLTETAAILTCQSVHDFSFGHVGAPHTSCEVKLVDVPEMGYTSNNNPQQGEVCVRGHTVFKGYYKNPEKTKECLTEDGWFHTGDIGEWLESGVLKIIDRKKNIFKLAQGEYVAAEKLEVQYLQSPLVGQIFVYGDSFQSYLVAICVLDPDRVVQWAKSKGITDTDINALATSQAVKQAVYNDLVRVARAKKMRGFEFIKNIHLEATPWTPETGELTPSMKQKRPILKKKYMDVISALYNTPRLDQRAKL